MVALDIAGDEAGFLRLLQPARIGRGTRSIEDPELVLSFRENRIHLELCPSSNVQIIPEIENMQQHPIDRLYREHISLNINTDTRMLTATTLTREYEEVNRVFGWSGDDFLKANPMAVDAAFIDDPETAHLRAKLSSAYATRADV